MIILNKGAQIGVQNRTGIFTKKFYIAFSLHMDPSACPNYICKHFNQVQNASFVVYFS